MRFLLRCASVLGHFSIPLFGTKFYPRQTAHGHQTRGKQRTWKMAKSALSSSDTPTALTRRARRRARSGLSGRVGAAEAPITVPALALAPPLEPGGVGVEDGISDGVGVGVGAADWAAAEPVGAKRTVGSVARASALAVWHAKEQYRADFFCVMTFKNLKKYLRIHFFINFFFVASSQHRNHA